MKKLTLNQKLNTYIYTLAIEFYSRYLTQKFGLLVMTNIN